MTPKTKKALDAGQGIEGNGTATYEGRRTMTDRTEYAHFEPQDDAQRVTVAEVVGNLLLVGLALIFTYCAVVGAVYLLTGMGVAA